MFYGGAGLSYCGVQYSVQRTAYSVQYRCERQVGGAVCDTPARVVPAPGSSTDTSTLNKKTNTQNQERVIRHLFMSPWVCIYFLFALVTLAARGDNMKKEDPS